MGTEFMKPEDLKRYDEHRAAAILYDWRTPDGRDLVVAIAKALADERERCAKIADEYDFSDGTEETESFGDMRARMIARYIRGIRGDSENE